MIVINDYPNHILYEDGKVFGKRFNKFLKPELSKEGYYRINLGHNYKSKKFLLHRLIAINFIPNPNNLPQVNHINGIKTDNRIENLEWVTISQNIKHAYKIGLKKSTNKHKEALILNSKKRMKKVINIETKVIYENSRLAADSINIKHTTLSSMLSGQNKNKTTLIYI